MCIRDRFCDAVAFYGEWCVADHGTCLGDAGQSAEGGIDPVSYTHLDVYKRQGNMVNTDKIISIISSDSAPAKRLIQRGKETETLIDATQGRRTKSVIFTENNKIILSALQPETLAGRFNGNTAEDYDDAKE